jgi:predicted nucleotidyltransferase
VYLDNDKELMIIELLKKEIPELQALYVFGSYAGGTATNESDIDIAYLTMESLSPTQRWDISQKLAILLSRDVDLVELAQTNTVFRYQILSCGLRIYGSGYDVENFETLAYSFYMRFQEERKPIVDEIMKNKSVHGKTYA